MERIYGIRNGGDRSSSTIGGLATQEDLAELDYPTRMK